MFCRNLCFSIGYYLYAEASGFGEGDRARILSQTMVGTANTCTKIKFYYFKYGEDVGALNLYILGNRPYYFNTPIWQDSINSAKEWKEQEILIYLTFDYTVSFAVNR